MNIGIIDVARILDSSKKGRTYSGKLRSVAEKWQRQIADCERKLAQTLERLQIDAEAETPRLDSAMLFKLNRDQRVFEMELSSLRDRLRFDLESHRDHFRAQLLEEMQPTLKSLAAEKDLSLILPLQGQSIPYAAAGVDVTEAVIARLDR